MPQGNGGLTRRHLLRAAAGLTLSSALTARSRADTSDRAGNVKGLELPETAAPYEDNLLDLVNPLQGTDSEGSFSRGNTLALLARPFSLTHWALQSRPQERWFFHPADGKLMGIRATHQPSPWMGDYGQFIVTALPAGEGAIDTAARTAAYRPEDLEIGPHYVQVALANGIRIEMTPSERAAIFRFAGSGAGLRVLIDGHSGVAIDMATQTITGRSNHNSGGIAGDFGHHFAVRFDRPFESAVPLKNGEPVRGATSTEGNGSGVAAHFSGAEPVVLRMGVSFISAEQALKNLRKEMGDRSFETVRAETAAIWNAALGRIRIHGGSEAQRKTFYTCLYRTQLFPRELHEFDDAGQPIHYSTYDGATHPGVLYGDSGFWDTYRTEFPLLSILQPARYGEMVQGFTNAFQEGGWFPQWPSPGYRAVMIGTHIDAVVADAVVKKIPGFDHEGAYAGLLHDADTPGDPHDRYGRVGLTDYLALGYVPSDRHDKATARSLDYYYDDFCVSQVAAALGKTDDAARLRERALGYKRVYDPAVGFMWGKRADGSWQENWDEFAWGGPYVEGGPWQSTWAVSHDPAGLMTLMGGRSKFIEKLDRMLLQSPRFGPGTYGGVIHEMAEMAAVNFGQYDQGNQPVHLVLYLFAAAGCPAKTQYWTRRVLEHLYSPLHYPGDEDNGEMSAWYVFSALGFYPLCPGHPSYVLGSPLFPRAEIHLPNGKVLEIEAPGNSASHVYVSGVTWNGKTHEGLSIPHETLAGGGRLFFEMTERPTPHAYPDAALPYSLSAYPPVDAGADILASAVHIDCGGDGDGHTWVGDCFFTGGEKAAREDAITSVPEAGPSSIYQSERYGSEFAYQIPLPMLPGKRAFTLRLHFAEIADDVAGKRLMNVRLNGNTVLNKWDLFAEAGRNKPVVKEYRGILPDHDGAIEIVFSTPADSPDRNAKISGIEVLPEE